MEKQGDAAKESEVGERMGIAAAGGIFTEGGVTAVVVAVLDTGPVGTAQVDPIFRGAIFPELAGKIEALVLSLVAGFLDESCAADFQDNAAEGEPSGKGFGCGKADLTGLYASVPAAGLGKKGDSSALMRAISKREGWLPLICRK